MAWKTFGEKGRGGLDFSTVWKTFWQCPKVCDFWG
jgi:hypothetical protein